MLFTSARDFINSVFPLIASIAPILLVWRWNLIGVLLGVMTIEIVVILSDILLWQLEPGVERTNEVYELWWIAWLPALSYCLLIHGFKILIVFSYRWFISLIRKVR